MRKLGLLLECMLISAGAAHAPPPPPPNSSSREAGYKPDNDSMYPDARHGQHQGPYLYPSSCTPPSAAAAASEGAVPSAGDLTQVQSTALWSPSCPAMMRGRMQIMRGRILRLTTTPSDKWGNALSPYWMARSMAGVWGRGGRGKWGARRHPVRQAGQCAVVSLYLWCTPCQVGWGGGAEDDGWSVQQPS